MKFTLEYDFGSYQITYEQVCSAIAVVQAQEMQNEENQCNKKPHKYNFIDCVDAIYYALICMSCQKAVFEDYKEYLKDYFKEEAELKLKGE